MLKHAGVAFTGVLGTCLALALPGASLCVAATFAQSSPASPPAPSQAGVGRQMGTVTSVSGNKLVLATASGQQIAVNVADAARILQLAPGSTNLKDAQVILLSDIASGDRVLVTGKAGEDPSSFEASRVILMKSSDIAQKHAMEQEDWQKRGMGGIVRTVDQSSGALTISQGTKKITVNTSSKTVFRRYAADSVKFEDAKPGTLAQVEAGDQLRVRGAQSPDGTAIVAEEVISGSFKNLAGTIATIDSANNTLTMRDIATKKMVTVKVTANSSVHVLPARAAAVFASRAKGGSSSEAATRPVSPSGAQGASGGIHAGAGTGQPAGEGAPAESRSAGMDLSQLVSRLPNAAMSDLKVGDAVMVVASQSDPGSLTETAVTLLSGVEPILAATPVGTPSMTLSPWNVGAGPDSGGQQ